MSESPKYLYSIASKFYSNEADNVEEEIYRYYDELRFDGVWDVYLLPRDEKEIKVLVRVLQGYFPSNETDVFDPSAISVWEYVQIFNDLENDFPTPGQILDEDYPSVNFYNDNIDDELAKFVLGWLEDRIGDEQFLVSPNGYTSEHKDSGYLPADVIDISKVKDMNFQYMLSEYV